ncbi:MAG: hypothetical protein SPL82_07655 [Lachnospiraceae bacterium]|nr:hypothetical protein [Lachnospiraceae bacterium]
MEGYEFYKKIREALPENFVDYHEGNIPGAGDLYVKKTAESEKLVRQYDYSSSVSTFESQTEPLGVWYEIFGGWCEEYKLGIRNFKSKASARKTRRLRRKMSICWITCGTRRLPQREPSALR